MNRQIRKDHFPDPGAAFHALVEGVREGAAILSFDGTVLTCNRRLAEMLKLDCEQVMGRPMLPFLIPDDQPRLEELLRSEPAEFQKLRVTLSGNNAFPLPVELAIMTLSVGDARVFSLLATDLSRRRRAEEQLAFQAHLLANVSDAVAAMDEQYRITYWNAAAERMYGYFAAEVLGRPAIDVVGLQLGEAEMADARRHLVETGRLQNQGVHHRRDGTSILVESTTTALHAGDGRLIGYVSVGRDITERKRAEDEIVRLNAVLEQRVADRTAKLENEIAERTMSEAQIEELNRDLERQAAELQSANTELESFSYSVSHDLRTPLASMDSLLQLLLDDYGPQLPESAQRVIHLIQENSSGMYRLIEDLLAFARSASHPLNTQTINMTDLARRVFQELARAQKDRQVDFRISELPTAQGDRVLLKQVWVNLLANALKFTRGRAEARIEVGQIANLTYYVKDNGAGFDMAEADKLFGVFRRLHSEEEFEGTGVGLAIVQRIIVRHGGRVWADAEVDKGATFYFVLPPPPPVKKITYRRGGSAAGYHPDA